jgi:hypothetical protein
MSVRDDALGTLAEWLPRYTFPESEPQSGISLISEDDDSLTVSYETPALSGNTKRYRIRVEVEEL